MGKLTHIASKDRQCFKCPSIIRKGEKFLREEEEKMKQ